METDCDHLEPKYKEIESRKVIEILASIGLYQNEIPYYGETSKLEKHTIMLCDFCQSNDVSSHSLELQIWWRDHRKADKERLEREQKADKTEEEKKKALSKLTDYEKELLGVN
ncbi:hypothetical protein KAR91_82470 [Candidatus Pacearchaeota archaeon]|nr:hypothetical protein [Candidatus Pacearchaeota archaeon]